MAEDNVAGVKLPIFRRFGTEYKKGIVDPEISLSDVRQYFWK